MVSGSLDGKTPEQRRRRPRRPKRTAKARLTAKPPPTGAANGAPNANSVPGGIDPAAMAAARQPRPAIRRGRQAGPFKSRFGQLSSGLGGAWRAEQAYRAAWGELSTLNSWACPRAWPAASRRRARPPRPQGHGQGQHEIFSSRTRPPCAPVAGRSSTNLATAVTNADAPFSNNVGGGTAHRQRGRNRRHRRGGAGTPRRLIHGRQRL